MSPPDDPAPPSGKPRRASAGQSPRLAARLGRAIQVLRTELGLSRKDLASRAALSYSYVSEIEAGRKDIPSRTLYRLADALEVAPSALMTVAEERVKPAPPPEAAEARCAPAGDSMRTVSAHTIGGPGRDTDASREGSWFRGKRKPRAQREREADPKNQALEELRTILDELSPEDRQLLLDFARRLRR